MPSEMYLQLLQDAADLHKRKSAGYVGQTNPDPWANFRESERIGVPAWQGALIRMGDKYQRILTLAKDASNDQVGESIQDTLLDLSAYALIVLCLLRGDGVAPSDRELALTAMQSLLKRLEYDGLLTAINTAEAEILIDRALTSPVVQCAMSAPHAPHGNVGLQRGDCPGISVAEGPGPFRTVLPLQAEVSPETMAREQARRGQVAGEETAAAI